MRTAASPVFRRRRYERYLVHGASLLAHRSEQRVFFRALPNVIKFVRRQFFSIADFPAIIFFLSQNDARQLSHTAVIIFLGQISSFDCRKHFAMRPCFAPA